MSDEENIVLVEIQITERVTYNKTLLMSKSKFDELKKDLDSKTCASASAKEKIEKLINRVSDLVDDEDMYLDTFEIYRTPEFKSEELPF